MIVLDEDSGKESGYYWLDGHFYIISDFPGAELRKKAHPDIPALPIADLEALRAKKERVRNT